MLLRGTLIFQNMPLMIVDVLISAILYCSRDSAELLGNEMLDETWFQHLSWELNPGPEVGNLLSDQTCHGQSRLCLLFE